ncbi:MAG: Fic family protein, partial [Candidatus Altiarchaeota archaeon]|nr:Fic family protein [Candidatus Altiarchaeota archaeon]
EEYRKLSDPFHTVLSEKDLEIIENLIHTADIKISHLSEKEWGYFTEHFTYDTNAIEGSTVTEIEVKNILEQDKWPGRKSRQEIAETYGVARAIKHIRKTKEHVSLKLIQDLHRIVFKNSKIFAGQVRGKGVEVVIKDAAGNIVHRGAPQPKIKTLLKELERWYNKNKDKYHPIVLAAVVHNQFENIHPFQDGNGRVGRLLLNNILLRHCMSPVNIELVNRIQYYLCLQTYENEGNIRPTIELILKEYKRLQKELKTI